MVEPQQKPDNSELHWFWKLTTKWWFFPVSYLVLAIFSVFVMALKIDNYSWLFFSQWINPLSLLITLLSGLSYYFLLPIDLISRETLDVGLGMFFNAIILVLDLFVIVLMIYIPYKAKKNIIPKKSIIFLFLILILSFFGFILGQIFPLNIQTGL